MDDIELGKSRAAIVAVVVRMLQANNMSNFVQQHRKADGPLHPRAAEEVGFIEENVALGAWIFGAGVIETRIEAVDVVGTREETESGNADFPKLSADGCHGKICSAVREYGSAADLDESDVDHFRPFGERRSYSCAKHGPPGARRGVVCAQGVSENAGARAELPRAALKKPIDT